MTYLFAISVLATCVLETASSHRLAEIGEVIDENGVVLIVGTASIVYHIAGEPDDA